MKVLLDVSFHTTTVANCTHFLLKYFRSKVLFKIVLIIYLYILFEMLRSFFAYESDKRFPSQIKF